MRFDSLHAKHKLFTIGLLLIAFAAPFVVVQAQTSLFLPKEVLAGGAVVGGGVSPEQSTNAPTNSAAQASIATGQAFTGSLVR